MSDQKKSDQKKSDNSVQNCWATAQKQQFQIKADACWVELAKVVTDCSFTTTKSDTAGRLPFVTWWQSCFQLLAPFQVRISAIHYKGDDESPEYIELLNDGPAIIDVSDWYIPGFYCQALWQNFQERQRGHCFAKPTASPTHQPKNHHCY